MHEKEAGLFKINLKSLIKSQQQQQKLISVDVPPTCESSGTCWTLQARSLVLHTWLWASEVISQAVLFLHEPDTEEEKLTYHTTFQVLWGQPPPHPK